MVTSVFIHQASIGYHSTCYKSVLIYKRQLCVIQKASYTAKSHIATKNIKMDFCRSVILLEIPIF